MSNKVLFYVVDEDLRGLVKRETEKAWLLASSDIGNKDTWIPKSGFTLIDRQPIGDQGDVQIRVYIKSWFWRSMNPDQEAVLFHCRPAA